MNEKGTSKMSTRKEDAMMKMKGIGYWATTSIVALELLAGGVTDLVHGRTSLVAAPHPSRSHAHFVGASTAKPYPRRPLSHKRACVVHPLRAIKQLTREKTCSGLHRQSPKRCLNG